MRVAWLAITSSAFFCLLLGSCSSAPATGDDWSVAESEFSQSIAELSLVESSMNAVLLRRNFTIRIPFVGAWAVPFQSEAQRPSDAYMALAMQPNLPYAEALQRLLDVADARQPIGSGDASACIADPWKDATRIGSPFEPSQARARAAKRLDAVMRVSVERCPSRGTQINNSAASRSSDTNFVALASEAVKSRDRALDAPYLVAPSDLRSLMLAQSYYFDKTEDQTIPISSYLVRSATRTFSSVQDALEPLTSKRKAISMVFNRSSTAIGDQLQVQPRGWFNAVAVKDVVYLSPTIVRAALVACAGRVAFVPSFVHRLRDEDLPRLKQRRITPADARGVTRMANQQVATLTGCIDDQLTFLIAHELAHSLLLVDSEEGADCIGAATARALGRSHTGIFDALIFRAVGTQDEDLLGANAEALAQLSCRRKAKYLQESTSTTDLASAISSCKSMVRDCG